MRHGPSGLAAFGYALFGIACVMLAVTFGSKVVGTVATLVTFAAIVWTAHETAALRAETVKQTALSQRAFPVIAHWKGSEIHVRNVGAGVALSLSVPRQRVDRLGDAGFMSFDDFIFSANVIASLASGEEARLILRLDRRFTNSTEPWEPGEGESMVSMLQRYAAGFRMTFRDTLGRESSARFRYENGVFNVWTEDR